MPSGTLENFVKTVNGSSHLRVEADLGDGFVRLNSEEAERRQAVHDIRSTEDIVIEMLRNARDAHAQNIFIATGKSDATRTLVVLDDGDGVPEYLHEQIFEPRVTSKLDSMHIDSWGVHGRGMALYSIAVNSQSARVVCSAPQLGSSICVTTELAKLSEKTDQSTFPQFVLSDTQKVALRGPKNILRTCAEFALECRESTQVYIGSATEIASTIYTLGLKELGLSNATFYDENKISNLRYVQRLAASNDPAGFQKTAMTLGLELSERSARRIMDGDILPVQSLLERVEEHLSRDLKQQLLGDASKVQAPTRKAKSKFKINQDDQQAFANAVHDAYGQIAASYYLNADVEPEISIRNNVLHVNIPLLSAE